MFQENLCRNKSTPDTENQLQYYRLTYALDYRPGSAVYWLGGLQLVNIVHEFS